MSFRTRILTPGATVFDAETEGLIAPGTEGFFGVLTGHEPTLATVAAGVLIVRQSSGSLFFALGDGVAEITPGAVTVYAEYAELAAKETEAEDKLEAYLKQMATSVPSAAGVEE